MVQRVITRRENNQFPLQPRDLGVVVEAVQWLRQLPTVTIAAPPEVRDTLRGVLTARRWRRGLWAFSALVLPDDFSGYFEGQRNANLRKSANAARRDGATASWAHGATLLHAINVILAERGSPMGQFTRSLFERSTRLNVDDACGIVVNDRNGHPISTMVGTHVGNVFVLRLGLGSVHGQPRWLATAALFAELHSRGVRLILGERMWALTRGNVTFQERLGFSPINLKLSARENSAVVSLVIE